MKIKSVYSKNKSLEDAIVDLKNQLNDFDTKMLVFFASSNYDCEKAAVGIQQAFSNAETFGCSSAHEFTDTVFLENSIVAMAFNHEAIEDVKVEIVEGISTGASVKQAFSSFSSYYKLPVSEMEYTKYVGIVMFDALSNAEDIVIDEIGDLTNVAFIGGSASDNLTFTGTYVYSNGKVYSDAVLLALLKPGIKFDIIKTQSFDVLDTIFTATETDPSKREVGKFNNKNAYDAYVEAIGISKEDAPNHFDEYTVGVMAPDDIYVRSPKSTDGKGMCFYSTILEGMDVTLLKASDIIKDTRNAIEQKRKDLGGLSGIINFHCLQRTLHLQNRNQIQDYIDIFEGIPTIGFSTYGEQYLGHVNQTSTMLVFK